MNDKERQSAADMKKAKKMPNNKAVLLSIQPVWCSKIVLKEKTVEVRKTKPEDVKPPFKCYIYCTKEQSKMGWLRIVPGKGWQRLDGMIIGEFVCDKIWELAPICRAPDDVEEMACMDRDRIVRYLNKCHGWAWHISDLKIYDQPKDIMCFHRAVEENELWCKKCAIGKKKDVHCAFCYGLDGLRLRRPPQSWCYVEELKDV